MAAHGASVSENSSSRIESLKNKHLMYKELIREARKSSSTTDFYLRQLKKQKLQIKDLMEQEEKKTRRIGA